LSLVLAIASATPEVSVAVGEPGAAVIGEIALQPGRRHGEVLAPAIESLCRLTGIELGDVGIVAVDVGPGLFTGLRVGVATAKALAFGLGIPMVTGSSLGLLAHPLAGDGRPVVAVVDARRGEVFWARFAPRGEGSEPVAPPAVAAPAALAAALGSDPCLLVGDGARRYAELFDALPGAAIAPRPFDHPRAASLIDLALTGPVVEVGDVTPLYLRGADVRIGWEQRDG